MPLEPLRRWAEERRESNPSCVHPSSADVGRPASTHKALALLAIEFDAPLVVLGVPRLAEPMFYAVRKGKTGHWAGGRNQTTSSTRPI